MSPDITALRLALSDNGYTPVPLFGKEPPAYGKNNKVKGFTGWQLLRNVNRSQCEMWARVWPDAENTGILTRETPAFDADILNEEAARAVEDFVRERFEERGYFPVRIGFPPKRAFLFQTDNPFDKITVNFEQTREKPEKIEFLCNGQQLVVNGIHPETQRPYNWFGGEPWKIKREELPYISAEEAQQLVDDVVELLIRDFGYVRKVDRPKRVKGGNGQFVNDQLANEADWQILIANILKGDDLHDSVRDLAAKYVKSGMHPGAAVNSLRALMESSSAPKDERWQQRFDDIPRAVDSALDKFAPEEEEPEEEEPPVIITPPPQQPPPGARPQQQGPGAGPQQQAPGAGPQQGPQQGPSPKQPQFILSLEDWLTRDLPEPDFLLGSWLSTTSRVICTAPTGLGKTIFAIALALHGSAGSTFLHWQGVRPAKILFIDGEMSRRLIKDRLINEVGRSGLRPSGLHILSHEDIQNFQPLNKRAGQAKIENIIKQIGGVDLIIFDNVMSLIAGDQKDEEAWRETLPWVRSLTRRSIGQFWVHHTGRDETRSYGTKTREWQMDCVIHLETVEQPNTDVSFKLMFRKARERTPATRADFADVHITLAGNQWSVAGATIKTKISPLAKRFFEALRDATIGNAANKMFGCPAASLNDWRTECIGRGLIDNNNTNTARALFAKYKLELIVANWIACNSTMAWIL
jgi:hypothetical protein